jgi:DNA-directed RNA polymerase specialized sigma24 family protein
VVGLVYYHGWTKAEVGELFDVSAKTVRRRWRKALLKLLQDMADEGAGGQP